MPLVDPHAPEEIKFRREFMIAAAAFALPLAVILVANPGIDLTISNAARDACANHWCASWTVTTARRIFISVFALVSLASVIATARVIFLQRRWMGLEQTRCLFLIAALAIGPGVVANLLFKDHLGRARPRDVIEFGGTKAFTPPLVPSGECARNCSFISGEASSIYAAFFALSLIVSRYRMALLLGGIAAGTIAGAIRIMQGAHFLSDVLFAGLFMALTVSLLHIALIGIWRDPRRTWSAITAPLTPLLRLAAQTRA